MELNVILVNDKIYGPSVGTFVLSITEFLGSYKNLYTLIYDKKNAGISLEGNKIIGFLPPLSSGWLLNTRFQSLVYNNFRKFLYEKSSKSLIHYTSQQVKPFKTKNATVTVHDLVPVLFPDQTSNSIVRMTASNLKFYKRLPVVSTVSNFTKLTMEEYGFESRIHVVNNTVSRAFKPLGIEKTHLRKKFNLPIDKKLILSVSANYPRKNLKIVEETVNALGENYALVRVGSPLRDSITFSNVDTETLNQIYNACDLFFTASSYEGFGLPALEAMASGIPVIASDIEIFREVTGKAAILSPISVVDFKKAIGEAFTEREKLIKLGFMEAEKYSFQNFCKQLEEFYKDALLEYGLS